MAETTAALTSSDILAKTIQVGAHCPDFSLDDSSSQRVNLASLREQGPVLISIYRGVW